ncbi:hypothetical protein [Paenibacillus sp. GP183]|uniref:hypothetical protein n=1 Tax=Paenibacillus sp. GP183 TaxID=1882751 RepID=UPI0011153C6B|nr:hypothetical protein [Paenibacillus sp. GP183]
MKRIKIAGIITIGLIIIGFAIINWHNSSVQPDTVLISRDRPITTIAEPVILSDASVVKDLYNDLLSIRQMFPEGGVNCPNDTGIVYHLSFQKGEKKVLEVDARASGCQGIKFSNGKVVRSSSDVKGHAFWLKLGETLGLSDKELAGYTYASELPVVKVSDIQSLQYEIVMFKENNPAPLLPSNAKDKVIIEKITSWMGQAKSEGFDNQVPTQSIPPNFLTIKLTNGSEYRLSPGSNDIVYVQILDPNKTLRLRSPELNTWLWTGREKDVSETAVGESASCEQPPKVLNWNGESYQTQGPDTAFEPGMKLSYVKCDKGKFTIGDGDDGPDHTVVVFSNGDPRTNNDLVFSGKWGLVLYSKVQGKR